MFDIIVVGGGVAGLMAAGTAAERGLRVVLLEKMEKPVRKLRITGKGRCNVTNTRPLKEFLEKVEQGADFVRFAFEQFDNRATINFFEKIGVPLIEERGGRVFPASGRAVDIAEALVNWCKRQGVDIRCNTKVIGIEGDFVVKSNRGEFRTKKVIITTGGVSYPLTGSTGDGYDFAYELGHEIVPLRPSLVPLQIDDIADYKKLQLRNVGVKLLINNIVSDEKFGDVDFTDVALSGATIIQLSRRVVDAIDFKKGVIIEIDLKPALSIEKLRGRIEREIESLRGATFKVLLQKLTPSSLHKKISRDTKININKPLGMFTENDTLTLIGVLKGLRFEVKDYRPYAEAIITAGGVSLDEIDERTMESKKVKGLYFAGEVMDVDCATGGYNIQMALSTAVLAAKNF